MHAAREVNGQFAATRATRSAKVTQIGINCQGRRLAVGRNVETDRLNILSAELLALLLLLKNIELDQIAIMIRHQGSASRRHVTDLAYT